MSKRSQNKTAKVGGNLKRLQKQQSKILNKLEKLQKDQKEDLEGGKKLQKKLEKTVDTNMKGGAIPQKAGGNMAVPAVLFLANHFLGKPLPNAYKTRGRRFSRRRFSRRRR